MEYPWYKNAILYGLDVHNYQDSDGDGCGDFQGLIQRLDYIQELGVTCLWLLPYYPSPFLDNGYDISDYYQVDRQTGSLENLADFVDKARQRGIRVLADLVLNHTSDQHPWFQAGRRDPHSRFHDYYVWSDEPVEVPENQQPIFPGEESSVWQYDAVANAYFYHRFYHFQPELNMANPAVQGEVTKALDYWLSFGLSGFRLDAASHMIEAKGLPGTAPDQPHQVLRRFHHFLVGRRPDAVLMGETDVDLERIPEFFAGGEELSMLMNFLTSEYAALALATGQAEQFSEYLQNLPLLRKRARM